MNNGTHDNAWDAPFGPSLVRSIQDAFPQANQPDDREAEALARAAKPLWEELARQGRVDGWAGAECMRVLPRALAFIFGEANASPGVEPWDPDPSR